MSQDLNGGRESMLCKCGGREFQSGADESSAPHGTEEGTVRRTEDLREWDEVVILTGKKGRGYRWP